jgi:hypothetical protein|tara:strand:- start:20 stop:286 length:267 start_codon:yes stop_codon:yes gene_type:complete
MTYKTNSFAPFSIVYDGVVYDLEENTMNSKELHGKDEELIKYIIGIIEKSCNMREIDKIHGHLEHLLYEASGMADYYENVMENYGGTD